MLLWKSSPQFLLLFHRYLQQLTMLCTLFDCSVFHYVKVKLILPTDTFHYAICNHCNFASFFASGLKYVSSYLA